MKPAMLFLFFTAVFSPAAAFAESGCPRGQDACSDSVKKKSGFLSDVEAAQKNHPPAATGQKAVSFRAMETPVLDSSAAVAAPKSGSAAQGGFSRPAWLLLAGGGLAALYYYLKDGKRRGRKK